MNDLISRQAAIDAINCLIDRFEQILRDIRESKVDDSVCGMCEYDGAFIGQSGDWVNECPGFDKEDCFKLSDRCRKMWLDSFSLLSAQPEQQWIPCSERMPEDGERVLATHLGGLNPERQVIKHIYANEKFTLGWDMDMNMDSPTFGQRYMGDVIAWMPWPEPYRAGKEDQ